MVDTQGLDLVKGKQDTDEEHLVLFLKGQGKAVDDARSYGRLVRTKGPRPSSVFQSSQPSSGMRVPTPPSPAKDLEELSNAVVMLCLIDEPEGRKKGSPDNP